MVSEQDTQKSFLYRPRKKFTADLSKYFCINHHCWQNPGYPQLEDDPVILYCRGGRGKIAVNGMSFQLEEGSVCLLQSFHSFMIVPEGAEGLSFDALAYDKLIQNFLIFRMQTVLDATERLSLCPVIRLSGEDRAQLERLLTRFEGECTRGDSNSQLIKTALLGQIDAILYREQKRQTKAADFCPPLGWRAFLYLTEYCTQDISLQGAAAALGCTPQQVNRELRIITSYGFYDLLKRARITRACAQLLMEDFSLRYIALYNGFSTENSFYRAFKAAKGMMPQEYRSKMLSAQGSVHRRYMYEAPVAILNYIVTNFRTPITLDTAASELFIVKDRINPIMKSFFGQTFQGVLSEHRLRYAEALLSCTELPICDISELSGFNSPHTLSRLFKARYAVSPGEYRQNKRSRSEKEPDLI